MEELAFKTPTEKSLEEDSKSEMPTFQKCGDFYQYENNGMKYAIYPSHREGKVNSNVQIMKLKNKFWKCLIAVTFPASFTSDQIFKILIETAENGNIKIIEKNSGVINLNNLSTHF